MVMNCVNYVFPSEIVKVKEVLGNIISCMETQFPRISESDLFDLRLVFTELMVNAVMHGNGGDSSKKVELTIEIGINEVSSVIRDEGEGFDYIQALHNEDLFENFSEDHGRGLRLVSSLTEYLSFNEIGNEIEFHKKISC